MKSEGILRLLCLFALCTACEMNDAIVPRVDYTDAIKLNKGNYWVYQANGVDLASAVITFQAEDSVFIARDTIVHNKVYSIVENPFGLREIKTQLSNEIVDIYGNIEFSGTNFDDTLYRSHAVGLVGFMQRKEEYVTVPAGTFVTICFMLLRKNSIGHHPVADPNNPSIFNKDYSIARKVWYAKNIGIVRSVQYFSNSTAYLLDLERYHVNN